MSRSCPSVAELITQHDPAGALFVAAPPCPGFSRIREDASGSAGSEGQKFTAYCGFANNIEMRLPHRRVGHLVENVAMEKGEADYFSSRLDCNMVLVDAQDLGIISRPRLWWTRVDWSKIKLSPVTGLRLKWSKAQKFHHLHQDTPWTKLLTHLEKTRHPFDAIAPTVAVNSMWFAGVMDSANGVDTKSREHTDKATRVSESNVW